MLHHCLMVPESLLPPPDRYFPEVRVHPLLPVHQ